MAYSDYEGSLFRSSPIELYRFAYGGEVYRYTSHNKDYLHDGVLYQSITISRESIRRMKDTKADNYLRIKIDRDSPVPQKFRIISPSKPLWVTVQRLHRKDPDKEVITIFTGRVRGATLHEPISEMVCDSVGTLLRRAGLRMNYQISCNHMLFGRSCGVPKSPYTSSGRVSSVSDAQVVVLEAGFKEDGWLKYGLLEYQGYSNMIIDHKGETLTLLHEPENLRPGDLVTLLPGCDRSLDMCWDKFKNGENYGGCPYIPVDNLFKWGL